MRLGKLKVDVSFETKDAVKAIQDLNECLEPFHPLPEGLSKALDAWVRSLVKVEMVA